MGPELLVLTLNAVFFGFAYLVIYPKVEPKKLRKLFAVDMLLSALIIVILAMLFWGEGVSFTLVFFEVKWWVFAIATGVLVEVPMAIWFYRKWDVDLGDLS